MMQIEPKDILFSLPTLCESTPAVDPLPRTSNCQSLHEDDWRQIEFVHLTNRSHIEMEFCVLTAFKQQYWRGQGWSKVYIRREHPTPLAAMQVEFEEMPALPLSPLSVGSGPPLGGIVKGGFALSDSSMWFIYGQRTSPESPSIGSFSEWLRAVQDLGWRTIAIAKSSRLLLVDWYAASIIDTSSAESISNWSRRYQKT